VAKLLIFRGETLLDQRELTGETLRIGRSAQSDIVLEDPGKGVSRNHAELRFEDGHYTLVDLQSQNGIWVSGSRVPSAVLDPNVVATVGPFRLMVEAPAAAVAGVGPDTAPIEPTQFLERSADPLVLLAKEPSPAKAEAPVPPADERPRAKAAVVEPPRPKPVDERPRVKPIEERPSAKSVPPSPPPAKGDQWYAQPRVLLGAVAAALLIAASALVAYKLVQKPAAPVWNIDVAQALIASGRCQEAMEKEITPALQANPNNREAQSLRDKCANPTPPPAQPEPTSTVPPAPTADEKLTEAAALLASNDCPKAQETVNGVLAQEPDNARAKDLLAKVNACMNPAPPPAPGPEKPQTAKAVPPEKGGLTPLPNETQKDYAARIAAKHQQYTEALALIDNQRYLQARRALDEIAQDVPAGYLDLAQRREELGNTIKAEAKKRFETAQAADAKNDFDGATEAYRRAHDLDASIQVDPLIQRLNDRKLEFGRARCTKGSVEYSFGNNPAAIPMLQDAVKYLPPTDECAVKAREALQRLGK